MTQFKLTRKLNSTPNALLKTKASGSTGSFILQVYQIGGNAVGLFTYTVPLDHTNSSAYVEDTNGNFITHIWNNRKEQSGTYTGHWDARDYKLTAATAGNYVVKVVTHNIREKFSTIGNTSFDIQDMKSMHRGYQFYRDFEENGNDIVANQHYVEGPSSLVRFTKANPQKVTQIFELGTGSGCTFEYMCSDANRIYIAVYDRLGSNVCTFVMAINKSDYSKYSFSAGTSFTPSHSKKVDGTPIPESTLGLLTTNDAGNIIEGLAVQQTGNYLIKTHSLLNKIFVHNKNTGALVQTITTITKPRACTIDNNDNLRLISDTNTVATYTINSDGTLGAATNILSGLVDPLNLSFTKDGNNLLLVGDGGSSQQTKAFSGTTLQWTHGQAGGQRVTPTVASDIFYFSDSSESIKWVSYLPLANGQFWVIQPGNNTCQLYNADRTPVNSNLGYIHYQTASYESSMDKNNTTRVFNGYREYSIDYANTDPLTNWKFTKNWRAIAPTNHFITTNEQQNIELGGVFSSLYTDTTNSRTYAVCQRPSDGVFVLVELVEGVGLRVISTDTQPFSLKKNGAYITSKFNNTNGYDWLEKTRTGFNSNNPQYSAYQVVDTIPTITDLEPYDYSGYPNGNAAEETDTGYRVLYQDGLMRSLYGKTYGDGYHLGLLKKGKAGWAKLLNKGTGGADYVGGQPLDGYYDNGDHANFIVGQQNGYGGGVARAIGNLILENVYGEFYRDGQQNQRFLWLDSGVMIYSSGTNSDEARAFTAVTGDPIYPGMAGGVHKTQVAFNTTNPDILEIFNAAEGGSGGIDRTSYYNMSSITTTTATTFTLNSNSVLDPALATGTINLLAKNPQRGNVYDNANDGWTQSRANDLTNKFGGGPYWIGLFGVKTYNIRNPYGLYLRYRSNSSSLDQMTWRSDSINPGATSYAAYRIYGRENFEDSNLNDGEFGSSNTGGMYRHLKDTAGKVLVRFYFKNNGNNTVSILANSTTIATVDSRLLSDFWYKYNRYHDISHSWNSTTGKMTVKYADYPSVDLTTPFESGGDFNKPGQVEYFVWTNGVSRDRCVAIERLYFTPGLYTPPVVTPIPYVAPMGRVGYPTNVTYSNQQIVALDSQAVNGIIRISNKFIKMDTDDSAILYNASLPLYIDNCILVTKAGNCIQGGTNCNIRVRNTYGFHIDSSNTTKVPGRFINYYRATNVDVENCYFEGTRGILVDGWTSNPIYGTINVRFNRAVDIDGRSLDYTNSNGNGNYEHSQLVQFTNLHIPNIEIAYNIVTNFPGTSRVEDNINIYNAGGTPSSPAKIHHNIIRGAYPYPTNNPIFTGTGLTTDGDTNDANLTASFNNIYDNTIISVCNAGINIATGHDNHAWGNVIINSGLYEDGTPNYASYCGMCIYNSATRPLSTFRNNTMKNNIVAYMRTKDTIVRFDQENAPTNVMPINGIGNTHLLGPVTLDMEHQYYMKAITRMNALNIKVGPQS